MKPNPSAALTLCLAIIVQKEQSAVPAVLTSK
jgi:hypothetical protein